MSEKTKLEIIWNEKGNRPKVEQRIFDAQSKSIAAASNSLPRSRATGREGLSDTAVFHSVEPRVIKKWPGPNIGEREND